MQLQKFFASVSEAKSRGLTCGVVAEIKAEADKCKDGDTKSVKCRPIPIVPSDEETQSSAGCSDNAKLCGEKQLCYYAATKSSGPKSWSTSFPSHISEAKRRGLTCGVAETKYKLKSYRTYKRTSGEFKGDISIYDASRQKGTERLYSKRDGWARFWTDYDKDKDYKLYSNTNNVLPALRSAFKQKSKSERLKIQRNLKNKRLYDSTIDGLWGRNTLVALTDYSSKRLRTIRLTDPQIVATLMDQILRDSSSGTVALASSEVINEVYAHLENANKLEAKSDAFASSFKKQTKLKRQQIQYALRKLGHYSFGVDGLWGNGTKSGLQSFTQSYSLYGKSPNQVFNALLLKVDVPSSFAVAKKKTTSSSKYKTALGYRPFGNTTMPVQQAIDVCKSGANNAFRTASDNARYKSNSYSGSCTSYGSSSNCRVRQNSPYGSDMGTALAIGLMEGITRGLAGNAARDNEMKACMAHYGWRKN